MENEVNESEKSISSIDDLIYSKATDSNVLKSKLNDTAPLSQSSLRPKKLDLKTGE